MAEANGAVLGEDKTGNGAPGDGSDKGPKDGKKAEDGEEFVPASRLKAALADQQRRHEGQLGNLRAEFEAFKAGVSKAPQDRKEAPKRFSRAELSAAVKAEQITQEQADDIFAKQVENDAVEKATRAALDAVNGTTQQKGIDSDLAQYKRLEPALRDKSSEIFERATEEFRYLRERGHPDNLATELAAIRAVLGPLDKLEKAKSAQRSAEHHEESGGGGEGSKAPKKVLDSMSAREKAYYQGLIDRGHHKDWAEVEKLLKDHARPELRRRAGAKV